MTMPRIIGRAKNLFLSLIEVNVFFSTEILPSGILSAIALPSGPFIIMPSISA